MSSLYIAIPTPTLSLVLPSRPFSFFHTNWLLVELDTSSKGENNGLASRGQHSNAHDLPQMTITITFPQRGFLGSVAYAHLGKY